MGDDDTVTRAEALRALAALGEPRAVQPLLTALDALDHAPATGSHRDDDETNEVAGLLDEAKSLLAHHTQHPRLLARVELNPTDDAE
ncbi:hypothetical protein [Virgisporangium ochraceum]|uniref:hypothetical protein n=1 Tax=Virgisporangium ochraceum TaxID=65505 RepID=UPI001942FC41